MEKRYLGRVELNFQNATVTAWDLNSQEEDNHFVTVWDIAGSPGWSWGFSVDGKDVILCKKGDKGYADIYSICNTSLKKVKADHSRVLDIAVTTGFLQL